MPTRTHFVAAVTLLLTFGCTSQEKIVETDFGFEGTCANCHAGLSAKQVHPTFKLRCVDCHGGNDQVDVPANASEDESIYRDPDLIAQAHVHPKPGLARFFWANGIDDDGDGEIDEPPVIEAGQVTDFGEIAELGLQGEGVGEFIDAEYNRDLNYLRWVNPGDLRVATASCGASSRPALDGEAGGACHQAIVETSRRSIMVNQAAVINGAYYGNESWRPTFQDARDANSPGTNQRNGAFGYTLDFAAIDSCIDKPAEDDADGRGQPTFNSPCLEGKVGADDPNAVSGAPGNTGVPGEALPNFEVAQGTLQSNAGEDFGPEPGQTIHHTGVKNGRIDWGGKPLADPTAALDRMDPVPDEDLSGVGLAGVPDPVDNILRGFRAYYPLNYPGSANDFDFTFGESILPGIADHKTRDSFGRGHSSGCSACHMAYNYDGSRNPQHVYELDADGNLVDEEVADPTTKHREFDPATQDIVNVDGKDRLVGMTVNIDERDIDGDGEPDRDQQRFYSADHSLTSQVTTDQCGLCHAFVTRINYAYQGMAEDEQRDKLAREKPIEFTTPAGTRVAILDSWVREDLVDGGDPANPDDFDLVVPDGDAVAKLAAKRNSDLEAEGLLPGLGGCAPNVFTEDCNNNGELDTELLLQRFDENGNLVAEDTINEDLNGNGRLDLISHVPRERSVDGRQQRYVYGGANGSTRLMDIHFERGMHCIDCHMIQDSHGDGNIYSTNWEALEIECEDCHGSTEKATLFTTGANGGNDLTKAVGIDRRPFFERKGDKIIQRSRVTPGLFWEVPQTPDTVDPGSPDFNERAVPAHDVQHLPPTVAPGEHNAGSVFAGDVGESELQIATLECYACHTSWVHNCMGCHYNMNLGDKVKNSVQPDGSVIKVAGENETWFNNRNQAGRSNFQLLGMMRSPIVLGTDAAADGGRLAPFRSSMQVLVSVTGPTGDTLFDNMTFTTFQEVDGNSGRAGVATSGSAMNQTMPHTVRPLETQGCETCHGVVNQQSQVENDNILAVTYGIGGGRYPYQGDWAIVAGAANPADANPGGLELFEYKQDEELAGNTPGASTQFPGMIVNGTNGDRTIANVEPVFDGTGGIDGTFNGTGAVFIRNFQPEPNGVNLALPTLRDLVVSSVENGVTGDLVISDVTFRGRPQAGVTRPSVGDTTQTFVLDLPDRAFGVAALAPDVSDPYVYVANGVSGLSVVKLLGAPETGVDAAELVTSVAAGGRTATAVRLAGDIAYVGTAEGTLEVYDLSDPEAPELVTENIDAGGAVRAIDLGGFTIYVATDDGIHVFANVDLANPFQIGSALAGTDCSGLFFSGGHLYVAAGSDGVLDLDVSIPADPQNLGDLAAALGENVNAIDVTVSIVPSQTWVLASDSSGDLVGLKLDRSLSTRERCLPDPSTCKTDLDWRDKTIMGRDPSLIGENLTPDPNDPSSAATFRQTATVLNGGGHFARPSLWEQIGTQSGRRIRDSFMPGSGVLSQGVMARMYLTQLCEVPGSEDVNGSGWGQFGEADDNFFATGECKPLTEPQPQDGQDPQARLLCKPGDPTGLCLGTDEGGDRAAPRLTAR